jgi:outer membrane protein TolC
MENFFSKLAAGALAVLLFAAAPASSFAEEYTLDDLCRIALTRSEILKVAEENLVISEIGTDKAFSYLLPRLTATGGLTQYSEKKLSATGSVIQPENA